jgi:hypothetical protein
MRVEWANRKLFDPPKAEPPRRRRVFSATVALTTYEKPLCVRFSERAHGWVKKLIGKKEKELGKGLEAWTTCSTS